MGELYNQLAPALMMLGRMRLQKQLPEMLNKILTGTEQPSMQDLIKLSNYSSMYGGGLDLGGLVNLKKYLQQEQQQQQFQKDVIPLIESLIKGTPTTEYKTMNIPTEMSEAYQQAHSFKPEDVFTKLLPSLISTTGLSQPKTPEEILKSLPQTGLSETLTYPETTYKSLTPEEMSSNYLNMLLTGAKYGQVGIPEVYKTIQQQAEQQKRQQAITEFIENYAKGGDIATSLFGLAGAGVPMSEIQTIVNSLATSQKLPVEIARTKAETGQTEAETEKTRRETEEIGKPSYEVETENGVIYMYDKRDPIGTYQIVDRLEPDPINPQISILTSTDKNGITTSYRYDKTTGETSKINIPPSYKQTAGTTLTEPQIQSVVDRILFGRKTAFGGETGGLLPTDKEGNIRKASEVFKDRDGANKVAKVRETWSAIYKNYPPEIVERVNNTLIQYGYFAPKTSGTTTTQPKIQTQQPKTWEEYVKKHDTGYIPK